MASSLLMTYSCTRGWPVLPGSTARKYLGTRMHSSRMRTARTLTVVPVCGGGGRGVNDLSFLGGVVHGGWSCPGRVVVVLSRGSCLGRGWSCRGVVDLWSPPPCDHMTICCHTPPPPPPPPPEVTRLWKHNLRSLRYAGDLLELKTKHWRIRSQVQIHFHAVFGKKFGSRRPLDPPLLNDE